MKKVLAAILILILTSLACGQYVTPTPAVSPTVSTPVNPPTVTQQPTDTASPEIVGTARIDTAIVRVATVNVHDAPGGTVTGYVSGGDTVVVLNCSGDWCKIANPVGYVWRGCLSGNEDRGCEAK